MTRAASVPPDPTQPGRGPLRSVAPGGAPAAQELAGGSGDGSAAALGIGLLRDLASQEITRAESARTRARQSFVLAAGFFAVVQTVAYGSFVTKAAAEGHRTGTLLTWTAWAALALALCGLLLVIAELPRGSGNLTPDLVLGATKRAGSESEATEKIAELLALIVESHRLANRIRFRLVAGTQVLAMVAIALAATELLVGLHATL